MQEGDEIYNKQWPNGDLTTPSCFMQESGMWE